MGAKIYNSNLTKEIIDGAKLQVQDGNIPSEIGNTVLPTMEVNPNLLRICNVVKMNSLNNALTETIYTTPSDKDFYICSASLTMNKDVTATTTNVNLTCTINGQSATLLRIATLATTADTNSISINPRFPIKIDRNTTISLTSATNVANVRAGASVIGFLIDNIKS